MKFDDIYIRPSDWCYLDSRANTDTSRVVAGMKLNTPIVSSNMDTVYSPELAKRTALAGGISCVHRFCSIDENVKLFRDGIAIVDRKEIKPWVSVGTNTTEWERCKALVEAGAEVVLIDVANAACNSALNQFLRIKTTYRDVKVVVGNFTTYGQVKTFIDKAGYLPDAIKVSVGTGSVCLTEKFTVGAGLPPIQTLEECKKVGIPMIFDGGFSCPSDYNKAMLWCDAVMMGRQFAGTYESSGTKYVKSNNNYTYALGGSTPTHSYYRGSAAADSYAAQGKTASFRPPEGKSEYVEITGDVATMLQSYQAALRSAMTYCDASTIEEYHQKGVWGVKNLL